MHNGKPRWACSRGGGGPPRGGGGAGGSRRPGHAPSQLEPLGSQAPGNPHDRRETALPAAQPWEMGLKFTKADAPKKKKKKKKKKKPCIPGQGTGPVPNSCCAEDRPGSGPSLVSVAGGRTAACCSRPKVAALIVGTLLFLTGIGAASWAIGEKRPPHPQAPEVSPTPGLQPACSPLSTVTILLQSDQEPLYQGE